MCPSAPRGARQFATVLRIGAFALCFRIASACLALLVNIWFPLAQPEQFTVFGHTNLFWDAFARYDSGWYVPLARLGYNYVPGGRSNIAYFPVYPLLVRYVGRLFGARPSDFFLGGIVVSWVMFIGAMVVLYKLACLDLDQDRAERAVLLAAIFPFALFFGVVYTESTFLFFAVSAFYAFRTRRWILGGLAGGLATATRVNGILILPALAWIGWRHLQSERFERQQVVRVLAGLVLVASGIGAYCAYIYRLTGNPFEWAATIQRWGYHPGGAPWTEPLRLVRNLAAHPYAYLSGDHMAPYDLLNGGAGILFVLAVPFIWRRLGAAYGLFVLASLWLPLSSGVFEGIGRYCAVLFPCFIWLASWSSRRAGTAVLVAFAMFYPLCLALFTNLYPIF
jgi:Mannosyltransferase (PIG-V)